MAARLDDVRAAIHKTAAGRMSQTTAPAKAPSSVSLDLDVLATQAQDYSAGAAAGAKQAQGNAAANEQLLNEDRASADSDRAQAIDLTRQNAVELELARQANAEKAEQSLADIRQSAALQIQETQARASFDAQEAQARAANAAAGRQVAQQEAQARLQADAQEAADDARGKQLASASAGFLFNLGASQPTQMVEDFRAVISDSGGLGDTLARIEQMKRSGRLGGSNIGQEQKAAQLAREAVNYYGLAGR